MEKRASYEDILGMIVDPESFIGTINDERVRMLLMELDMLSEDFERENVIMYLASNFSSNKHLSFTVLRGMKDDDIKELMASTRVLIVDDIQSRKKNRK